VPLHNTTAEEYSSWPHYCSQCQLHKYVFEHTCVQLQPVEFGGLAIILTSYMQ